MRIDSVCSADVGSRVGLDSERPEGPRQGPCAESGRPQTAGYRPYCCELCGRPPEEVIAVGNDFEYGTLPDEFQYAICRSCQHTFLAYRPDESQLAQIYPASYYTVNPQSPLFLKGFIYRHKIRSDAARILKLVEERNVRSILDVGCGDCSRLMSLDRGCSDRGLRLSGLDIQFTDQIRRAAAAEGIELIEGSIETLSVGQARYDLILMSQLLEHLFRPRQVLGKVLKLLNHGGMLVAETPQWQSLDGRLFRGGYWGGYHWPRHFNVFSMSSLRKFVQQCGFDVVEQGLLPSPGFWILSLRNMLKLNSRAYSRSVFEFLSFHCLPVVAMFTLLDKATILLKGKTSNQYVIAQKPRHDTGGA